MGVCAMCRMPIEGRADYDHALPVELGGESTLENCQVLCVRCHKLKTGEDIRGIRKAGRQRDKANGSKRTKQPMRSKPPGMKYNWATRRYEKDG